MSTRRTLNVWLGLLLAPAMVSTGWATNYYVAASGSTPTPPYTNWGWAHTNLIEVVARTRDGDTVYLTNNATYYLTNQVSINYAITVRSWRPDGDLDPVTTIINGNYSTTTNRCFYLNNYGAWLKGLTITNGCMMTVNGGGGVWLAKGHLTNCVITGNRSLYATDSGSEGGGGMWLYNGSGTVWNCTISHNTSYACGGGIKVFVGGPWLIANSMIAGNVTTNPGYVGAGGGISANIAALELRDCLIVSNRSSLWGGGVDLAQRGDLVRCVVAYNTIKRFEGNGGAGAGIYMSGGTLRNCVIRNNYTFLGNSYGAAIHFFAVAATTCLVQNCTISSNISDVYPGIFVADTRTNVFIENSIIWANSGAGSSNYYFSGSGVALFTNCCTAPDPGAAKRTNCVFSDPRFAGLANGNVRLQSGSPCINTGVNRAWMDGAMDVDGLSRIDRFFGQVDMGAYEYLPKGILFRSR